MASRWVMWGLVTTFLLLALGADRAWAQAAAAKPSWQARFDAAAGLGWFNARPDRGEGRWYNDSLWYGVEAGYFLTEHVKLEAGVSAASEGQSWSYKTVPVDPRGQYVSYLSSQHDHRVASVSAGVVYQFGRNAWVHPYLGAGVDIDRDRVRTAAWVQPPYDPRDGGYQPPYQLPDEVTNETRGRLFGVGGVKVFFSQRVFFKADLKAAGWTRLDKLTARALVGADF